MAVPVLAQRANPRPDLLTHLFFAMFLVLLWGFHRTDLAEFYTVPRANAPEDAVATTAPRRQWLWMLPLLMLLWVNVHPGFVAGLGIIFAYVLAEGMEGLFASRRQAALERLRLAWRPLAATIAVIFCNPYGPAIFKASLQLAGMHSANQPSSGLFITELEAVPISLPSLSQALDWRNPDSSFWWLALTAVVVVGMAFWRRYFGAALLMTASLYASIHNQRYKGLFSIVAVVVGSSILAEVLANRKQVSAKVDAKRFDPWQVLSAIAVIALCLLTCVRIGDVISNRAYFVSSSTMLFGAGESWWFPERAAAFIQHEHLPGNIFQPYELGGFTAWRLGPAYGDFIDGRNVSPAVWTEFQKMISSPPDSPLWEAESTSRNINVLFLPKSRIWGLTDLSLASLCQSRLWRPIYLDEVSIVLLRNRPENRSWIDRDLVNCATHEFAPPEHPSREQLSNFYANVGTILAFLGRSDEAKEALDRAATLSPEDPTIHHALAQLYEAQQQFGDAEREYKAALGLREDAEASWFYLGRFYFSQGRFAEARPLVITAIRLSQHPFNEYSLLGHIDLALRHPQLALEDFGGAEDTGAVFGSEDKNRELFAQIAEGRAGAYSELGEWQRAIEFQQAAIQNTPENVSRWEALATICENAGRKQLAERAREQARALSK
ncbi:MAG: tetratricopeptide repeat protein [Terriglobales bacterium]